MAFSVAAISVEGHTPVDCGAHSWVRTIIRWGAILVLVTQFLFAHGCHGDEDHELFGIVARIAR